MPKKIRRSNNRLRKTNRKVRKTANRNRLRKFVGGYGEAHWVERANGLYTIDQMEGCKTQIDVLKNGQSGLVNELLKELSTYLSERIDHYRKWEKDDAAANAKAAVAIEKLTKQVAELEAQLKISGVEAVEGVAESTEPDDFSDMGEREANWRLRTQAQGEAHEEQLRLEAVAAERAWRSGWAGR